MEKYSEEDIKEGMKGIHQIDLQNRLRKFYQEREKIQRKKDGNMKDREILEENLNLCIKIYEENLPMRVVERARRSGGVYKTQEEFSVSVKKEKGISEDEREI